MANIADLLPLPEKINIGRGTIDVTGIPLNKLVRLLGVYQNEAGQLYEEYKQNGNKVPYERVLFLFPEMVASIIAIASDAEGQEADVRKIAGPTQIEALMAIWKLTVPDAKKLQSLLSEVMALLPDEFQKAVKGAAEQTKAQPT
jgi:hypothetical protein